MSLVSTLRASAFAAVAASSPSFAESSLNGSLVSLDNLSIEQVQFLLREWKLDRVFGEGFLSNQYDGLVLDQLVGVGPTELEETLGSHFPNVVLPQWGKLSTLLNRVHVAGGVEVDTLIATTTKPKQSKPSNSNQRRQRRRQLSSTDFNGYATMHINQDEAQVALGADADVILAREGSSELVVRADVVSFTADTVEFSADNGLIANGTDLVKEVQFLLAEAQDLRRSVRVLNEEMYYVMTKVNTTCTAVDEAAYSCDDLGLEFEGECLTDIGVGDEIWTDRTYAFEDAPGDLLDTFHTYVQVEMDGSPPCNTEGGYYGTFAEDAQIAICCANHGTYSSAGNKPYATSGTEGISNAYGLTWTEHSGEFSISNHGGTPCTFSETFLEAGEHLICCSEGWATGVFVTTPEVTCS